MGYYELYRDKLDAKREAYVKEFEGHQAFYQVYDNQMSVLDWRKPDTNEFAIRYVFDGQYLYISGDLGSATFRLTWYGTPQSLERVGLSYFMEKCESCQYDRYDFSHELLVAELDEKFEEWKADQEDDVLEDEEVMTSVKSALHELKEAYNKQGLIEILHKDYVSEDLSVFDSDYWEWASDLGSMPNGRFIGYLVGLQLATAQL